MTTVREVMTKDPIVLESTTNLVDAARRMRDEDVGNVLVKKRGRLCGIVTDRDIITRALAEGQTPAALTIDDVCSHDLVSVAPGDDLEDVVRGMVDKAIRRMPVVENQTAVGILSLGDVALERDPESALAEITAAQQNN